MPNVQETTLSVPDIECDGCVNTIQGALKDVPGVQTVQADATTKQVHLSYDPHVITMEKVESVLSEAGYPVAK
jgi:copper chaperone CopZ